MRAHGTRRSHIDQRFAICLGAHFVRQDTFYDYRIWAMSIPSQSAFWCFSLIDSHICDALGVFHCSLLRKKHQWSHVLRRRQEPLSPTFRHWLGCPLLWYGEMIRSGNQVHAATGADCIQNSQGASRIHFKSNFLFLNKKSYPFSPFPHLRNQKGNLIPFLLSVSFFVFSLFFLNRSPHMVKGVTDPTGRGEGYFWNSPK